MDFTGLIIRDLTKVLRDAYPKGDIQVEEYRDRLFVTVLDEEANEVSDKQILQVLERAEKEAIANKKHDDLLWRSLAAGVRIVKDAEEARKWRKDWEEVDRKAKEYEESRGRR